ncbi:terminase small subunit [Sphingomonas soli]|uniref:terminase small subunit n=1 Tax=Sphingomonas soli TaxID=266127 RepID=UPI000829F92E|nr:terminase small subunit [Sphingomonas soli]
MALTPKQQRFVEEYLVDLNATQAAIRAGYSARTAMEQGYQLLQNPSVADSIAAAKAERSAETKIDANYVLLQAVKLHERCMQEVDPVLDRRGQQIRDDLGNPLFEFNAAGAAKALELVGKHVGVRAFSESLDVTVNLTPEARKARIAELVKRHADGE